jgi:hypothetical protein
MTNILGSVGHRWRASVGITLLALATGLASAQATAAARPRASESRRVNLVESARLTLTDEKGSTLVEHGRATGTYDAPVTAAFTIHPKSVTAVVTIFPKGGSIGGTARANYVVKNSLGYFGGTFSLTRGTGKYRNLSEVNGKALGISGIINRYSFEIQVKAHGEVSL